MVSSQIFVLNKKAYTTCLARNTLKMQLCLCLPWTNRVESAGVRKNFSNTVQIIRNFFFSGSFNSEALCLLPTTYHSADWRKFISLKNWLFQPAVRCLHGDSPGRLIPEEEITMSAGRQAPRAPFYLVSVFCYIGWGSLWPHHQKALNDVKRLAGI